MKKKKELTEDFNFMFAASKQKFAPKKVSQFLQMYLDGNQ